MPFVEAIGLALQTIRAQKLKSAFSLVGVFIGVTFLIAAWSIVNGMNTYMTDKFAATLVGVNTFNLRQRPDVNFNVPDSIWRAWRRRPRVTFTDAETVVHGLTVPALTAVYSEDRGAVEYGGKLAKDITLQGVGERYFEIKSLNIAAGRAFTPQEERDGATVAVLGWELAQKLFPSVPALGKYVRVHGIPYRVIGVVERQGNLLGISLDKFLTAPAHSPIQREVNPPGVIDAMLVKAPTLDDMRLAMDQVEGIMRSRRHLRPTRPDNFALETSEGVIDFWQGFSRILYIAGPGIVMISLVVGGIVIMNIMLMAVAERTREIGIRKSLGARRRDILRQFLAEATAIAALGAAAGVAAGILLSVAVQALSPLPARVSPASVLLGIALGGSVGVIFGVYPASRASRLDPIAAMRHE